MSVDQQILVDGHLKRRLLHDFAEAADSFDDDIVEEIWQHLDVCEGCMEDYESIREGGITDKKDPATAAAEAADAHPSDHIDPASFTPDEMVSATVKSKENDAEHINGLMPVGDDPDRNGLPDEYVDDEPEAKDLESSGEAVSSTDTETDEVDEAEDTEEPGEKIKNKAQAIEGLISGKITASEEPAEKVETESLAENETRTSRERIQASLLKEIIEEPASDETENEQEVSQDGVEESDDEEVSDIDGETEPRDEEPLEPEAATETVPPAAEAAAKKPRIEQLKPSRPRPPVAAKQEPLEEFFNKVGHFVKRPRNAIICGVAVVAAVAAMLYFLNVFGPPENVASPVAGWEPLDIIETRVPLQEVIMRKMRKGKIPAAKGPDVTLDFRGISRLVIAVDLDFIKGKTLPHEVIVLNPAGEEVFHEAIPQIYLDDGRFFLRLLPKLFETEQSYTLDLTAGSADGTDRVIAQSIFDVLK